MEGTCVSHCVVGLCPFLRAEKKKKRTTQTSFDNIFEYTHEGTHSELKPKGTQSTRHFLLRCTASSFYAAAATRVFFSVLFIS